MSEQESFLDSHVVHFGIGTPSRILKLLQNGNHKTFAFVNTLILMTHLL